MPAETQLAMLCSFFSRFYTIPRCYRHTSRLEAQAYGTQGELSYGHATRECSIQGQRFRVELGRQSASAIASEAVEERITIPPDEPSPKV